MSTITTELEAKIDDAIDLLEVNGYTVLSDDDDEANEYNYVGEGQVRIRLTGSIRDTELEEVFEAAYAKHDYKLADYLRQLSETDKPTIQ